MALNNFQLLSGDGFSGTMMWLVRFKQCPSRGCERGRAGHGQTFLGGGINGPAAVSSQTLAYGAQHMPTCTGHRSTVYCSIRHVFNWPSRPSNKFDPPTRR